MAFSLLWRVTCCGSPIYEGRDEALASRIFDHLFSCTGHRVVMEETDTAEWTEVARSPNAEGAP
jgi:hypothetical protein